MGHFGKHRIDPETGLCEICDRTALQEVHRRQRPGKRIVYSNGVDNPYDQDQYNDQYENEITPRRVRKLNDPLPTIRPRPKVGRPERTPIEDIEIHRPPVRVTAPYYVDREDEPPPRGRPARIMRRRAETPPPFEYETRPIRGKRQTKSDIDTSPRYPKRDADDSYYYQKTPRKAEMYSIEAVPTNGRISPTNSSIYRSRDDIPPVRKFLNPRDRNQRPPRLEPIEQKYRDQPSPTVVRRVYKKHPPGRTDLFDDYYPNETQSQIVRRPVNTHQQPPKHYVSSPQLTNRNNKNPSIYYVRSVNDYY